MRRSLRSPALVSLLLAVAAAGCQDYRFNPVNACLLQPGSESVAVPRISSADVLFVVDDSNSMAGKQAMLSQAFDTFVSSLNAYNDLRAANHLEPFDFHIAITTTSVFYDQPTAATCQSTCGSSSNVCGTMYGSICSPMRIPQACPAGTGCGAGYACKTTCSGHAGEAICCDASGANLQMTTVSCTTPGTMCGQINQRYAFDYEPVGCTTTDTSMCSSPFTVCTSTLQSGTSGAAKACGSYPGSLCCEPQPCAVSADCATGFSCGGYNGVSGICVSTAYGYPAGSPQLYRACDAGVGVDGALYPQGDFVGIGTNPRVLHFDKSLYATPSTTPGRWDPVTNPSTATNHQHFTRAQLAAYFKQNVKVGTCGSGQEQGLQGARLAVTKALAGQQLDVVNASGQPVALPGVTADWPHAGAKLVVVYVGDEDDCSSPADPVRGLVLTGAPPLDSCQQDQALPLDQQKEYRVTDFVAALTGLNRPLGAAFIVSATAASCEDASCTPAVCQAEPACYASFPANQCGGVAPGTRFIAAGDALRFGGADVIDGSICNGDFGPILGRIAEIVKPPSAMTLPTAPAAAAMTMLRITDATGATRKVCRGPALPPLTAAEASAAGYDWWFTASDDQTTETARAPSSASRYVYVNQATFQCVPNPGEGYSVGYLGMVPAGGCVTDADCTAALGGRATWTCYAGTDASGVCVAPQATSTGGTGTCVCNPRTVVCPKG